MHNIAVVEKTRTHVLVKIPRYLFAQFNRKQTRELSETVALKILRAGMQEYREGKTKTLASLRELRHAH